MCRMLGIIGEVNSELLLTFRKLAETGKVKEGWKKGHKDGWGIGYYENGNARRIAVKEKEFNEKTEREFNAYTSKEFEKVIRNFEKAKPNFLLAHLRKASDKSKISEEFCHPFLKDNILFQHNGGINGERWINQKGKIDSQILFDDILKFYDKDEYRTIFRAIENEKKLVKDFTSITFLMADEKRIFAYRNFQRDEEYYTLYYVIKEGEFFTVCSEKIEIRNIKENNWNEIKNNEILIVDAEEIKVIEKSFVK